MKANPLGNKNAGVSLPPPLIERAKELAASRGLSLSALVSSLLTAEIADNSPTTLRQGQPPENPIVIPKVKRAIG